MPIRRFLRSRSVRRMRAAGQIGQIETSEPLETRMMLSAGAATTTAEMPPAGAGSALAFYGQTGQLITPLDAQGNRIADFSTAGYRNSDGPLPDLSVIASERIITVLPEAGDDGTRIQNAIDQIGALDLDENGFRGIVQLTAGEYQIAGNLQILDGGVVLRGVGDGDDPASSTILVATGTAVRNLIEVGPAEGFVRPAGGGTANIVDKYVPVGATSFRVDSTFDWQVGDVINIRRPSPQEWIDAIGMDEIPNAGPEDLPWQAGEYNQDYERVITRIEGDRLFFNAPLMNSFEQQFGGGTVFLLSFPERIENVGIEGIRGRSEFAGPEDENHARSFIVVSAAQDVFIRDITGQHFVYATVHATLRSIRVTVDGAASLEPISEVTGGRRYPFNIDGQFILMKNLFSEEGRHDFVNNARQRNRGPNVFLNGVAVRSTSGTGPHQRWSTGTLYDTITTNDLIEAHNGGNFGSGHGWRGANMVFWNNVGGQFSIQNPPTAQNWSIGGVGQIIDFDRFGPQPRGIYSEHGSPIDFMDPENPLNSLYVAQRNQRLAVPSGQRREYVVGDYDLAEYDGAASVDEGAADAGWASTIAAFRPDLVVEGLDTASGPQIVPLTFDFELGTDETIAAAVLSLGLRGSGGDSSNDALVFESTGDIRSLASLGVASLATDETTVLTLELTAADIAQIEDGQLNLAVGDNTLVDWGTLKLTVAPAPPNEPPTIETTSFSIEENSVAGTIVGQIVASAGDPRQTLTYEIGEGTGSGAFAINDEGVIRVVDRAMLDFESNPELTFELTVRDDGVPALETTSLITVSVTDNVLTHAFVDGDGELRIEGNNADNWISVERIGTPGNPGYRVTSLNGGPLTAGPGAPAVGVMDFAGFTGRVAFEGQAGNDRFVMANAMSSGGIGFDGGDGDDILDLVGIQSQGGLVADGGLGNDSLYVAGSSFTGVSTVSSGAGSDRVELRESRFTGRLLVENPSDATAVFFVGNVVEGSTLFLGNGGSTPLWIAGSTFLGPLVIAGSGQTQAQLVDSSVTSDLTLSGGSRDDAFGLANVIVRGQTLIGLGHGFNRLDVRGSRFFGNVNVIGGNFGQDEVAFLDIAFIGDFGPATAALNIDLFGGSNYAALLDSDLGSVNLVGREGSNRFVVRGVDAAGAALIQNVDGASDILVLDSRFGQLEVLTGSGTSDVVRVTDVVAFGFTTLLDYGGGADVVVANLRTNGDLNMDFRNGAVSSLLIDSDILGSTRYLDSAAAMDAAVVNTTVSGDFVVDRVTFDSSERDAVLFWDVAITGQVRVDLGRGNNVVDATRLQVGQSLSVIGGIGFDEAYFTSVSVGGDVLMAYDDGPSRTVVRQSDVSGRFDIFAGSGFDVVDVLDSIIAGGLFTSLGDGGEQVTRQ